MNLIKICVCFFCVTALISFIGCDIVVNSSKNKAGPGNSNTQKKLPSDMSTLNDEQKLEVAKNNTDYLITNGKVNTRFNGNFFEKADLSERDFSDITFYNTPYEQRADFNGANLKNTNFSNAQLFGSSFLHTNINGSKFVKANLEESVFSEGGIAITKVNFEEAQLTKSKFYIQFLNTSIVDDVKISFNNAVLNEAEFFKIVIKASFAKAMMKGIQFKSAVTLSDFTNANLENASFIVEDLDTISENDFTGAILKNTKFILNKAIDIETFKQQLKDQKAHWTDENAPLFEHSDT